MWHNSCVYFRMKHLLYIVLFFVGLHVSYGQETKAAEKPKVDDCPQWKTPKRQTRADYMKYVAATKRAKTRAKDEAQKQAAVLPEPPKIEQPEVEPKAKPQEPVLVADKEEQPQPMVFKDTPAVGVQKTQEETPKTESQDPASPTEIKKESESAPATSTSTDGEKKQKNGFWKKIGKMFSRKNNKASKPNYKKCPSF